MRELHRLGMETKDKARIVAQILHVTGIELVEENYSSIIESLHRLSSVTLPDEKPQESVNPSEEESISTQKIGLIKSLLKQREGVEDEDTILSFLSFSLDRDVTSFSQVTKDEAAALLKELMKPKN